MKNRKSCSEHFPIRILQFSPPNPSTIRRQVKRFKETGSVKNRKVNRQRHVLTDETLDDIRERLEKTQKISKMFIAGNWSICVSLYKEQQNY